MSKRKIEIFSAGCPVCHAVIDSVKQLADTLVEVEVLDMHRQDVAARAMQFGVRSVPAVAIDGKLANCCTGRGIDLETLRRQGVGH
jgi:glutaredoxin 3